MKFDPTKPVRTRDGKPARIICTDRVGNYPIIALVQAANQEEVLKYKSDGKFSGSDYAHPADLENIREKFTRTVWLNVYSQGPSGDTAVHSSREAADRFALEDRIACVAVDLEFEEGQGL